jgi:O-antigen/teichoic acid export membrane protein
MAFAVFWGMSSVAPEIVGVFLGTTWDAAVLPLQILAFIMPLRTIGNFIPNAVQAVGRSDILLKNAIVLGVIGPSAFIVGVHWGLVGLCVAWLVATPLIFVQNTARSLPVLELRFGQVVKAMWPPAFAGAIMYATLFTLRLTMPLQSAVVQLIVLVSIGAVLYIGISLVVNREGLREARDLWFELIPIRRLRLDSPK